MTFKRLPVYTFPYNPSSSSFQSQTQNEVQTKLNSAVPQKSHTTKPLLPPLNLGIMESIKLRHTCPTSSARLCPKNRSCPRSRFAVLPRSSHRVSSSRLFCREKATRRNGPSLAGEFSPGCLPLRSRGVRGKITTTRRERFRPGSAWGFYFVRWNLRSLFHVCY